MGGPATRTDELRRWALCAVAAVGAAGCNVPLGRFACDNDAHCPYSTSCVAGWCVDRAPVPDQPDGGAGACAPLIAATFDVDALPPGLVLQEDGPPFRVVDGEAEIRPEADAFGYTELKTDPVGRGTRATVAVRSAATGGSGHTGLAAFDGPWNQCQIGVFSNQLITQFFDGTSNLLSESVPYVAAVHQHFQVALSDAQPPEVTFQTSPDGTAWSTLRVVQAPFTLENPGFEIFAGTSSVNPASPGIARFDDFIVSRTAGDCAQ